MKKKMQSLKAKLNHEHIKKQLKASADSSKIKPNRRSHIPFRLNFLFFIIFGLFVALVGQLGYLQIVNGENIAQQLKSSSTIKVKGSTPRGTIYDAAGKVMVTNNANSAITFTRGNKMTADELLTIANKLNELIDVPVDKNLRERDKKDFWLADKANLKKAAKRLTADQKQLSNSEQYALMVDKVKEEEINLSEEQAKAATIFKRMNAASALNTVFVKNRDVTEEELAIVAERTADLPGVSTGTDWTREYVEKGSLRSLLGNVTTEEAGLPAEEADQYLAKGYARNDRVGSSYLEKQYEEVLQGTKSQYEISLDHQGNISSQKEIFAGKKGSNLVLTIDTEFQKKVEEILKNNYNNLISSGKAQYSPGIYAIAMNPKTGAVLSMAGFTHQKDSNEIEENALGTIIDAFVPGSVVKGGTLTAGWQNNVLDGNEVLYDEPIKVDGTAVKTSIFNPNGSNNRNLTARQALEVSSNAYMMKVAFRLLGMEYSYNVAMPEVSKQANAFAKLRTAFAEYGMGTKTGIDLPNEESGIVTPVSQMEAVGNAGKILDLAFGQFDTYTPIQLAQYVSTVANGGKRIQPHVVSGIYNNDENGELGSLKKAVEPKILNTVSLSKNQLDIIQGGFYDAVHGHDGWTTATGLASAKMDVSAKTGTAETEAYGQKTINSNIVAYGPSDDPEVAIAIMLPNLKNDENHVNVQIAKEIMDTYHDMFLN